MKILLWLSWWVDSAVAAYLLKQQWHEVVAGFMINYMDDQNPNCPTREDRKSAIEVCKHLDIPFEIFDYREEYEHLILDYIYDGYQKWITPNPDVYCNNLVKFGLFLEEAKSLWFEKIATWHYAQIIESDNIYNLYRGVDYNKDQSYFLAWLDQNQLSKALFPLWKYTKPQIRQIAKDIWLPNANRPDSQWLCFVGKINMKDFLTSKIWTKPWYIYDLQNNIVWKHNWAYAYTIWQRRQIWLNFQCYVSDIDIQNNSVTIARTWEEDVLYSSHIYISYCNWIIWHNPPLWKYQVKIRYRQDPVWCTLDMVDNIYILTFDDPIKWVANWQIAVIYDWDKIIWNWVIQK